MFLLPICLLCACKGRERVFPFFLRLAALCMVLLRRFKILLGARSEGTEMYHIEGLFSTPEEKNNTTYPLNKSCFLSSALGKSTGLWYSDVQWFEIEFQ